MLRGCYWGGNPLVDGINLPFYVDHLDEKRESGYICKNEGNTWLRIESPRRRLSKRQISHSGLTAVLWYPRLHVYHNARLPAFRNTGTPE